MKTFTVDAFQLAGRRYAFQVYDGRHRVLIQGAACYWEFVGRLETWHFTCTHDCTRAQALTWIEKIRAGQLEETPIEELPALIERDNQLPFFRFCPTRSGGLNNIEQVAADRSNVL